MFIGYLCRFLHLFVLYVALGHDFIEQPEDTKVDENQPIVLKCQIRSTPAATVLWERSNLPLPHSTRYKILFIFYSIYLQLKMP